MPTPPAFVFVTCQPGSNLWLKADVLTAHPGFRFAFSRPGLITFKCPPGQPPIFEQTSPLASSWGYSLGRATDLAEVFALVDQSSLPKPVRLHVFERDPKEIDLLGPRISQLGERAGVLSGELLAAEPKRFLPSTRAEEGDWVLDVVATAATEPEEPWLVGWHRQAAGRSPFPGGPQRVLPPPEAPSRAYAKLEEVVAWAGIELRAGQTAVEIGCAPGGASLALLRHGVSVVGIDPAHVDVKVTDFLGTAKNRFRHVKKPAGAITPADLPKTADWLLCDVNLAPPVALQYVDRISSMLRASLKGLLLTLKLNDDRMHRALPDLLTRVGRLGFGVPRAIQLPSNRSEVSVVARRG